VTRRPTPRVFERLADAYRARPGYPDELVRRLLALAPPSPRVVDLGAGTGHLAEPLARAGAQVVAVEPASAMLAVCAELTEGLGVTLLCAPAEATGLPPGCADLVLLADAAQWVDPEAAGKEAHRLLVKGGTAAAVEPRPADSPFMQALGVLLQKANPERRLQAAGRARQWVALASGGASVKADELLHCVDLAPEAFQAVLRSLSFLEPALGAARMETLLSDARTLADQHQGARWERVLRLSWARKR
jgi:SAM-dependent methyltransferase